MGAYFGPDIIDYDREYRLMGDALAKFKHEARGGPAAVADLRNHPDTAPDFCNHYRYHFDVVVQLLLIPPMPVAVVSSAIVESLFSKYGHARSKV